jgi:hypothetical protein
MEERIRGMTRKEVDAELDRLGLAILEHIKSIHPRTLNHDAAIEAFALFQALEVTISELETEQERATIIKQMKATLGSGVEAIIKGLALRQSPTSGSG